MILFEKGIICDGGDFAPRLEQLKATNRLIFKVLVTRGGNTKKNYDIFEVKCFGDMAVKYYHQIVDEKRKGQTVALQLSLENNSDSFLTELICTYMRFDIGEDIVVKTLPDCAKKFDSSTVTSQQCESNSPVSESPTQKVTQEVSDVEVPLETSKETNVTQEVPNVEVPLETSKETNVTNNSTPKETNVAPVIPKSAIENKSIVNDSISMASNVILGEAPIGLVARARNIIMKHEYGDLASSTCGDLAHNEEYLQFRKLMG